MTVPRINHVFIGSPNMKPEERAEMAIQSMIVLATGEQGAQHPKIKQLAEKIRGNINGRNKKALADAVYDWIVKNIAYVRDPQAGFESLATPLLTAASKQEDCDGHATLQAALLLCLGVPAQFVLWKPDGARNWSHVYVQAEIAPNVWHSYDTTTAHNQKIKRAVDVTGSRRFFDVRPLPESDAHRRIIISALQGASDFVSLEMAEQPRIGSDLLIYAGVGIGVAIALKQIFR